MGYQDFTLQIVPRRVGSYVVYARSQQGEGKGPFVLPLIERGREPSPENRRERPQSSRDLKARAGSDTRSPEMLGEQLFRGLFPLEVLRLYESSLNQVKGGSEAGLRIKLMLDPNDPELAPLLALPWELLRQPDTPEFLGLSRWHSIVRYLMVPRPVYAAKRPSRLRILTVAASPRGRHLPLLDLERERRNLSEALRSADAESVETATPTLAGLRQALLAGEFHVLHFMGHGSFRASDGGGVLYFETANGEADPILGADLANKLADFPMLRLVVLNSCQSARISEDLGEGVSHPFAGVASSLVMAGLPAVIAMQASISDRAAIAFSQTFYQRLAAGDAVDAAVVEGRQAIHSAEKERTEWATPVLFMRTKEGELFPAEDLPPEYPKARWPGWLAAGILLLILLGGAWFLGLEYLIHEGATFLQENKPAEARENFLHALALAPSSAEAHANLAIAEEHLGNLDAAEGHHREAIRLRPDNAGYLYNLGNFLNGRERYEEAYPLLKQAVRLDERHVGAYNELARAALGQGLLKSAHDALQAALRIDGDSAPLYNKLGQVDLLQKNPRLAVDHLNRALDRYPLGSSGRLEALSFLADAYHQLDEGPGVCRSVAEFRSLDREGITPRAPDVDRIAMLRSCHSPF